MRGCALLKIIFLVFLFPLACWGGWSEPVLLDSTIYYNWPRIEARHDSVYLLYDDMSSSSDAFIRSLDGGRTWQDYHDFDPGLGWSWTDLGLKGDTLAAFFRRIINGANMALYFSDDFGLTWQGPRYAYGYLINSEVDCTRSGESLYVGVAALDAGRASMRFSKSLDFGLNWSAPRYIRHYDTRTIPRIYKFFGRIFIISSSYHYEDQAPIRILYSDDEGESWVSLDSLTPVGANQRAEMAASVDGKMAFAYHWRVSEYPYDTSFVYLCVSSDSGSTWSPPIDLSISTRNAVPRLDVVGDTIAVCWFSGNGFAVRQSYDFGQTWGEPDILDPLAGGDLVLDNGKIHAAYVAEYGDFLALFYRRWEPDVDAVDEGPMPTSFSLSQNYPNPFNASTTIGYTLSRTEDVGLTIYNIQGQIVKRIACGRQEAGEHSFKWDAAGAGSGIYFIRLAAGNFVEIRKAILLK